MIDRLAGLFGRNRAKEIPLNRQTIYPNSEECQHMLKALADNDYVIENNSDEGKIALVKMRDVARKHIAGSVIGNTPEETLIFRRLDSSTGKIHSLVLNLSDSNDLSLLGTLHGVLENAFIERRPADVITHFLDESSKLR